MTNYKIRAKRTNDGEGCAPEYANRHLAVEIDFGKCLHIIKELSINIYASDTVLMGCDTVFINKNRKRRRISFSLGSVFEWESGTYHAMVYMNGVLHFTARLQLTDSDDTACSTLEKTEYFSVNDYFEALENEMAQADDNADNSFFDDLLAEKARSWNGDGATDTADNEAASENTPPATSAEETLNRMIGLKRLKAEIHDASIMAMFAKKRRELQLDTTGGNRNHMLFLGNPGTGKTTVAKLIGMLYHEMGILSIGHTVETNRSKLVGEYIGQTEQRMTDTIKEARGGVLFIDEAYTLIESDDNPKDFGRQVVNSLLTVLSEPDPDMIVIMAGYEDKMQTLLKSNPGLKDRFPLQFHFDNYTADELTDIARYEISRKNFTLTPAADQRLARLIADTMQPDDRHFGNARWVGNLIDHAVVKSMAKRVMSAGSIDNEKLAFSTIEECDIAEAARLIAEERPKPAQRKRIGFAV